MTVCRPAVNPPAGAQLQAPVSSAVAVHRAADPSWTVTAPSGIAVPETDEASLTVAPLRGVVMTGAGGKARRSGTQAPVTATPTLCTVRGAVRGVQPQVGAGASPGRRSRRR